LKVDKSSVPVRAVLALSAVCRCCEEGLWG